MTIRRAKKKDINVLSVLFDKYRIFYKQKSNGEAAKSFLKKRMKRKESVIFVAEEGDELIGFTQLFPIFSSVSMKRTWLLNDLYVSENQEGSAPQQNCSMQQRGLGQQQIQNGFCYKPPRIILLHKRSMKKMDG